MAELLKEVAKRKHQT